MSIGSEGLDALATQSPATQAGQVRLGRTFVNEYKAIGVEAAQLALPAVPPGLHVRAILLIREERLFFSDSFILRSMRQRWPREI